LSGSWKLRRFEAAIAEVSIGGFPPSDELDSKNPPNRAQVPLMAQRLLFTPWRPVEGPETKEGFQMGTLLLIILVLMVLGSIPRWGYSRSWGYAPSGGLGLVLLIILILVLMGYIPHRF
jgi:hypothetical protein